MKLLLRSLRSIHVVAVSALALWLCPTHAIAAPCQTGSLASYEALDTTGGCTIGGVDFFRFSNFSVTTTGSPAVANASTITITPIITDTGVGFSVSAMQGATNLFSIASAGQSAVYNFDYSLDPFLGDLGLDPPSGNVTATQNYCLFDYLAAGCPNGIMLSQTVTTLNPNSQIVLSDSKPIFLDVSTTIALVGPANLDALNIIYGMGPAAVASPEPASFVLFGLGVALFGGVPLARKFRRT